MKAAVLYICTLSIFLHISCNKISYDAPLIHRLSENQVVNNSTTQEVTSTITNAQPSLLSLESTRTKGRENLTAVFFVDERNGWVAGEGALYKTVDGGHTWEKVTIKRKVKAKFTSIYFATALLGWVVEQNSAPDVLNYQENQFRLMQTNDGGKSWRVQYQSDSAVITHISFVDEREGWLTGIKYIGLSPLRYDYFVLHTSDQGQHWSDVSHSISRTIADEEGMVNDWITDIIPQDLLTALALSAKGRVFKTIDGGREWQHINTVPDELLQSNTTHLAVSKNGYLRVASGLDSIEGTLSTLTELRSDHSWTRYKLGGAYFADVLFLSELEALACGSISTNKDTSSRREGVILHSPDRGQSWSVIYRNPKIKRINGFAEVNSKHIWAVGADGLILRFTTP